MGNAINGDCRIVWQTIRAQGGWWTVKQIVTYWRPTFAEWEANQIVQALVSGGFLARREMAPSVIAFAFTSDCQVLPGTPEAVA